MYVCESLKDHESKQNYLSWWWLCCSVRFGRTPTLRLWKARTPKNDNIPQELNQISFYCPISFVFQSHGNSLNRNSSFPCSGISPIYDYVPHLSLPIGKLIVPLYKNNCSDLWNIPMLQTPATIVFVSPGSVFELLCPFRYFQCPWVVPDSVPVWDGKGMVSNIKNNLVFFLLCSKNKETKSSQNGVKLAQLDFHNYLNGVGMHGQPPRARLGVKCVEWCWLGLILAMLRSEVDQRARRKVFK